MSVCGRGRFAAQVERLRAELAAGQPAFEQGLSEEFVAQAAQAHNIQHRKTIYTPYHTVWTFLAQVLHPAHSCVYAVQQLLARRVQDQQAPCSPGTSAYCAARSRLPEEFCRQLPLELGRQAAAECPPAWKFQGRDVHVVDGTTLTMPDTPQNRAAYPLADSQRAGVSYPIVRMLVVFSLAVGVALEYALRPYVGKDTGEWAMFRELFPRLAGGIVLADRGFCSYADVAALQAHGADIVLKPNRSRTAGLKFVRRLGTHDALYRWPKPKHKPDSLSQAEWDELPDELLVRVVEATVRIPGFRVRQFRILTTLLDAQLCPAADLAELYRQRWRCELFLRDLKTTLAMEHLRCKTPALVRKEIAMHLLAYNLIRTRLAQAAYHGGVRPEQLSFKSAQQALTTLAGAEPAVLLATILHHRVGRQPNRVEPRKVRRRPKPFDLLTKPRAEERKEILANSLALNE